MRREDNITHAESRKLTMVKVDKIVDIDIAYVHTERMLYSSEYHALSQNVAINPGANLRYFGSILH